MRLPSIGVHLVLKGPCPRHRTGWLTHQPDRRARSTSPIQSESPTTSGSARFAEGSAQLLPEPAQPVLPDPPALPQGRPPEQPRALGPTAAILDDPGRPGGEQLPPQGRMGLELEPQDQPHVVEVGRALGSTTIFDLCRLAIILAAIGDFSWRMASRMDSSSNLKAWNNASVVRQALPP